MARYLAALLVIRCVSAGDSSSALWEDCPHYDIVPLMDRCAEFRSGKLPSTFSGGNDDAHHEQQQWALRSAVPPLLISQPGAGNTMTRMLLEYASGYQTGACRVCVCVCVSETRVSD